MATSSKKDFAVDLTVRIEGGKARQTSTAIKNSDLGDEAPPRLRPVKTTRHNPHRLEKTAKRLRPQALQ